MSSSTHLYNYQSFILSPGTAFTLPSMTTISPGYTTFVRTVGSCPLSVCLSSLTSLTSHKSLQTATPSNQSTQPLSLPFSLALCIISWCTELTSGSPPRSLVSWAHCTWTVPWVCQAAHCGTHYPCQWSYCGGRTNAWSRPRWLHRPCQSCCPAPARGHWPPAHLRGDCLTLPWPLGTSLYHDNQPGTQYHPRQGSNPSILSWLVCDLLNQMLWISCHPLKALQMLDAVWVHAVPSCHPLGDAAVWFYLHCLGPRTLIYQISSIILES